MGVSLRVGMVKIFFKGAIPFFSGFFRRISGAMASPNLPRKAVWERFYHITGRNIDVH